MESLEGNHIKKDFKDVRSVDHMNVWNQDLVPKIWDKK